MATSLVGIGGKLEVNEKGVGAGVDRNRGRPPGVSKSGVGSDISPTNKEVSNQSNE